MRMRRYEPGPAGGAAATYDYLPSANYYKTCAVSILATTKNYTSSLNQCMADTVS